MPCLSADLPAPFNGEPSPHLSRIFELDEEIGQLAAHLNAANCRLLELIVEFDELGGYADQGALILKALEAGLAVLEKDVSAETSDNAEPPPKRVKNLSQSIVSLNRKMKLSIDEDTLGLWDGSTMDYSESVEQLQIVDGRFVH